ncbi:hypothetical protein D3C76_1127560 [compost metagenome]
MRVIIGLFCIMMVLSFGFTQAADYYKNSNLKSSTVLTGRYDKNQLLAAGSAGHAGSQKQACTCGETKFECKKDQTCDCVSIACED